VKIDAHVHVYSKVSSEFPRETTEHLPADAEQPAEKLLERMEASGIDRALLIQIGGLSLEHHAYLLHCLKTYPDRFQGIGRIPDDAEDPVGHMDRLAETEGIIGFRLFTLGGPDPLSPIDVREFRTYPIWKRAAEKDYVIWLYPQSMDVHLVPFLLEAFPQVRVGYNHLMVSPGTENFTIENGRPKIETRMPPTHHQFARGMNRFENVYALISGQYAFSKEAWPYKDLHDWHHYLLRLLGAGRLMWGTDHPFVTEDFGDEAGYDGQVRLVEEIYEEATEAEREAILGGTAEGLLRFK
jgi:L-fuconolactonase